MPDNVTASGLRRPYTGILLEPFPRNAAAAQTILGNRPELAAKRASLLLDKLVALCTHYDCELKRIEATDHLLELGSRYVPGFRFSEKGLPPGRPEEWDDIKLAIFWMSYIARRLENKHLKQTSALKNMGKDRAFGVGFSRLKEQIVKAKKSPLVQMMMSPNDEDRKFATNFLGNHLA